MKRKIIVAGTAGFCWGVNRAFDKVLNLARSNINSEPLFTFGPLIHNPVAVKMLIEEGVEVLNSIPAKLNGTVFIRTHGISPNERARLKKSGATINDATCPDVGKIQAIVKKHLKKGYNIIIVGNSEHPEVRALLGFAEGNGICITSVEDLGKIPDTWKNICVVAQSTQKEESYIDITKKIREKRPHSMVFNTICKATACRQGEARELSKIVDAMVVVGGYNSANTNKLAQICREMYTPTFHIEEASELNINDINKFAVIGVTAGASTPGISIQDVLKKLKSVGNVEICENSTKYEEKPQNKPLST